MPDKKIQEHLFQQIKEALPPGRSLVDTVADVLCVSQDSAYRRIRGETLLVLEEAFILCKQFHLSLDLLMEHTNSSVLFQHTQLDPSTYDFAGFLQGILQRVKQLQPCSDKHMIYVCKDIPIFHQLSSNAVLAFRYFFWMRNVFQHPDFVRQNFSMDCLSPAIIHLGREVVAAYNSVPSTEIWSVESINGILLQVAYYVQAGLMSRDDMQQVYAGLRHTLEHLQLQAAYGCKFMPGEDPRSKKENFRLFFNRMGVDNNTILTTGEGQRRVYLNYDALSYIETTDEGYCQIVHEKLQSNMRRSTLISSVSEKQRNMFFNTLYGKLPLMENNNAKMAS